MYDRILVPLDGSELAEGALPHALAVAQRFGATLTLLQVIATSDLATFAGPLPGGSVDPIITTDVIDSYQKSAHEYLEEVSRRLAAADGLKVAVQVTVGSPAREIARVAGETGADLIAMSTHGHSGLGRLVFGSVADQVLRESQIPILLVRPPNQE